MRQIRREKNRYFFRKNRFLFCEESIAREFPAASMSPRLNCCRVRPYTPLLAGKFAVSLSSQDIGHIPHASCPTSHRGNVWRSGIRLVACAGNFHPCEYGRVSSFFGAAHPFPFRHPAKKKSSTIAQWALQRDCHSRPVARPDLFTIGS